MSKLNYQVWKQSLTILSEMNSGMKNRCKCIIDDLEGLKDVHPATAESALLKCLSDVRELEVEVERVSKDIYPYLLVQAMKGGLYASLESLVDENASEMESLWKLDTRNRNEVIVA